MEWISIKDKLPEHYGTFIVCAEKQGVFPLEYTYEADKDYWAFEDGQTFIGNVTHWMPLPAPPHVNED